MRVLALLLVAAQMAYLTLDVRAVGASASSPRLATAVATIPMRVDANVVADTAMHEVFVFSYEQIMVVDLRTGRLLRTVDAYRTPPDDDPETGVIAYDQRFHLLAFADKPGNLVILDTLTWQVRQQLQLSAIANDIAVDGAAGRVMVTLSAGWGADSRPRILSV
jgi:hypothetical protein